MQRRIHDWLGLCAVASFGMAVPQQASAATTVLTFEGLDNAAQVGNFYAPDYVFSPGTIAFVDFDAGGTGNFANEPSPNTTITFIDAASAILNVVNGFDTGFSFFYSSSTTGTVNVWSGLDATGTLLGQVNLLAQFNEGCGGDPTGQFCNWTSAGISFAGVARSIDFGGTANQTGYDNITFGSAFAGGVPEPATWALLVMGFGAMGAAMRRRRRPSAKAALPAL